jgi:hypothetical protein
MKTRAVPALGLLSMFLAGCVQSEQVFTLNPDGSGKVAVTLVTPLNPFEQALGGGGPPGGKKLSLADKKRMFVDKLLSSAKGVDAWKDVSAEFTREGLLKFQGTAYFKDLEKFKFESGGGSPVKLVREGGGALRLVFMPEALKSDLNPGGNRDEEPDLRKLKGKELDEYILSKRVEYQATKGLFTALLTDLKYTFVYRLPGDVSGVKVYRTEGKRSVALTLEGNKILKAMNDLMTRDDDSFRKELLAGALIDFRGDTAKSLKALGLNWHEAAAVVPRPGGPQFDYAKESAAAREAYPALRQRLGLGEEKKGPDLPQFDK